MSSVTTQTDSFQDLLEEKVSEAVHIDSFQDPSYLAAVDNSEKFRKVVHIDSFQDPPHPVTFDFFQDHLEEKRKLVHIDSFQDPSYLAAADNLEEFRKLVHIDSFQDHHSGLYGNSSETNSFQDPCDTSN